MSTAQGHIRTNHIFKKKKKKTKKNKQQEQQGNDDEEKERKKAPNSDLAVFGGAGHVQIIPVQLHQGESTVRLY